MKKLAVLQKGTSRFLFQAFKQLVVVIAIISITLSISALPVLAQQPPPTTVPKFLPLPEKSSYGNLPAGSDKGSGQQQFYDLVFAVVMNVRYIIGAVAIALLVYAGLKMVIAGGKEEEYTKGRQNILWAIIGLALVGFTGEIVRIFSVNCDVKVLGAACTEGGFLKDSNAIIRQTTLFNQQTQFIIVFIKYIIGSISILLIVRNGIRMIAMGSQEEKMAVDKKNLFYGILGLLLVTMSDTVINKVVFVIDPSRYSASAGAAPGSNVSQAINEIVGFTNLIMNILGPIAILGLLWGAILYTTSAGNEENQTKAKRIIIMTIAGILIMYGAFAIVSTIISGQFSGTGS